MPHSKRATLATTPRFLRAPKAEGGTPKVDPLGGYRRQGIIRGVSVTTRGEALGHGMWLDQEFVDSTTRHINSFNKGVKARFTHPGLSSDGLGTFLGRVMNAETKDGRTIADLHFSQAGHNTPDGDLAAYVMDLASEDPEAFGLSIVFEPDLGAEDLFTAGHKDEHGNFTSPDADNAQNLPHARLAALRAADVVDEPAANPDGLFHREQEFAKEADSLASYVLGLSTERPQLVSLGLDAERAKSFVTRFLNQKGLEVKEKMADEPTSPAVEPETKPEEVTTEPTPPTPEPTPAPATPELSAGQKYIAAFGEKGAVWFVEGKSFDECLSLQNQLQAEQITSLTTKVSDLETRLAAATQAAGETEPLEFQSGEKTDKKRKGFASKIRIAEQSGK